MALTHKLTINLEKELSEIHLSVLFHSFAFTIHVSISAYFDFFLKFLTIIFSFSSSQFSTKDKDNDQDEYRHCADDHKGGWWFAAPGCIRSVLNGLYGSDAGPPGIIWEGFQGLYTALKRSEIKIKPKNL